MIKALRITSVLAVVSAIVVLALVAGPAWLVGLRGGNDERMNKILSAPSAVDRFKEHNGGKPQDSQDTMPPLVKQAEILAGIMKPPALVRPPATPASVIPRPVVTPQVVTAKFTLVGTSYSRDDPRESFAYISLGDGTYQWVRQGEAVGHLIVKEIRKDSIVCWDGSRDAPMPVTPPPETANMLETARTSAKPVAGESRQAGGKVVGRFVPPPAAVTPSTSASTPAPRGSLTEGDRQALGELADRLKQLGASPADKAAAVNKLISEFRSSRVSTEETEKLEDLGKELNENKDRSRDARRHEFLRRLSAPRPVQD